MIGQWPAHRFLARRLVGCRHLARRLGLVGLQVFQLQFELLDLVIELFGLAAELHAPQFGDHQLQMLDLGGARVQLFAAALQPPRSSRASSNAFKASMSLGRSAWVEHAPSLREAM